MLGQIAFLNERVMEIKASTPYNIGDKILFFDNKFTKDATGRPEVVHEEKQDVIKEIVVEVEDGETVIHYITKAGYKRTANTILKKL